MTQLGTFYVEQNGHFFQPLVEPFRVRQIPGLAVWLDSQTSMSVLNASGVQGSAGDPVSAWSDLSGSGQTAIQGASSQRPIVDTTAFGGKESVSFDGIDDMLSGASFDQSGSFSIIVVFCPGANASTCALIGNRYVASASDRTFSLQLSYGTTPAFALANASGAFDQFTIATTNVTTGINYVVTAIRDASALTSKIWLNSQSSATSTGVSVPTRTVHPCTIGRETTVNPYLGKIAEIAIFSRAITDPERLLIESRLKLKWGIA